MCRPYAFLALLYLFAVNCSEWNLDRVDFLNIITVGTADVTTDRAFLLGDIENLRSATIRETGFLLTTDQLMEDEFRLDNSNIEKYLSTERGEIKEDRSFAAIIEGLQPGSHYLFRAYAVLTDGRGVYGLIDSFTTLSLNISIEEVSRASNDCPTDAVLGLSISITGDNSDSIEFGIVWHHDLLSEPTLNENVVLGHGIDQDGKTTVSISVDCDLFYKVRPFLKTRNGKIFYDKSIEFTSSKKGAWYLTGLFPRQFETNQGVLSFVSGANGYLIGVATESFQVELWKYNSLTNSWILVMDPGRRLSPGENWILASNDRIIGGSRSMSGEYFEFNVEADRWELAGMNPLIFDELGGAGDGFVFNNKIYVTSGDKWMVFDINNPGSTVMLDPFPGGSASIQFIVGNEGFMGMGFQSDQNLWKFRFTTSNWSTISEFPEEINSTIGFSMNSKGYVICNTESTSNLPCAGFWEYDPPIDEWIRLADVGRGDGSASFGFAIDGVVYAGLGVDKNGEPKQEYWKYVRGLQ